MIHTNEEMRDVVVTRDATVEDLESDLVLESHKIGTVFKKHKYEPNHPTQFTFVWSVDGSDDFPLSEREVKYLLSTGYFKEV